MFQMKQQPKFKRNPRIRFRHNCDTDGRTTDGRRRDERTTDKVLFYELCWHSQAELKIQEKFENICRNLWKQ